MPGNPTDGLKESSLCLQGGFSGVNEYSQPCHVDKNPGVSEPTAISLLASGAQVIADTLASESDQSSTGPPLHDVT